MLIKSLFVSLLLMYCWWKQITWPSPKPMWRGPPKGINIARYGSLGSHQCNRLPCQMKAWAPKEPLSTNFCYLSPIRLSKALLSFLPFWLLIKNYQIYQREKQWWMMGSSLCTYILFRIWPFEFLPEEKLKFSSSHLKISSAFKQIFLQFCPACLNVLSKRDGLKQADLSLLEADIPQKGRRWRKALQGRG